jgi:hypothetical protein
VSKTDIDALEYWAIRASQALQDVIDDAEDAGGGENCCPDLRELLNELNQIIGDDSRS